MKKFAIVLLAGISLTACSESQSTTAKIESNKPTLSVAVSVAGKSAKFTITTDLRISKEHYGGERKAGEGHIHTYLDGGDKVAMDELEKTFTDLTPGKHEMKVSLHNNDHTPYDVTKTVQFEVK